MGLAFNQRRVVCINFGCDQFNKKRIASLPIVHGGLFLDGMVLCKCGYAPTVLEIGAGKGGD